MSNTEQIFEMASLRIVLGYGTETTSFVRMKQPSPESSATASRKQTGLKLQQVVQTRMKGETNALDYLCGSDGTLVTRDGEFLHTRRIHSFAASTGHRRSAYPSHPRTNPSLS